MTPSNKTFTTKQQLFDYMKQTDPDLYKKYINAPAAARHHSAFKGGIVVHSSNVYNNLLEWKMKHPTNPNLSEEDCVIVGYLHDLCKAVTYIRNTDGSYRTDKELYQHHALLSIQLIEKHLNIELTTKQRVLILLHMSSWSNEEDFDALTRTDKRWLSNPQNVLLLQVVNWADMKATYTEK